VRRKPALWVLGAVGVVLVAAPSTLAAVTSAGSLALEAILSFALVGFYAVGVLIRVRRPGNRIGGLLLVFGVGAAASTFIDVYADADPALPGAVWAAWAAQWSFVPMVGLLLGVLLLFPDGIPVSRRWRIVGWLVGVGVAISTTGLALAPGPLPDFPLTQNPAGVAWLVGPGAEAVGAVGWLLWLLALPASAASLIVRFRRSVGDTRQQLRWLVYAGSLFGLAATTSSIVYEASGVARAAVDVGFVLAIALIPVAVAVAVLKYRLYELDRIVSRTLAYGLLTALLAGVYVAAILVLQTGVRLLTGETNNSVVVATSTLAVAAVAGPARRRSKEAVDRRFNRRSYDAATTLQTFGARLGSRADLESVSADLLGVVREAMQPASVALWVRGPAAGR